MVTIKTEIERLQAEAEEVQRRYPNAPALPDYMSVIEEHVDRLRDQLRETIQFVDSIQDPRANEIGWLRLVEGLTYAEIADIMGYTSRHVQRLWKPYQAELLQKSTDKKGGVSGDSK